MKSLSSPTLDHLQGETTTFAVFWSIARKDGQVFRYTSHDRDVVDGSDTYRAASGILPSNVAASVGKGVDNLQIAGLISAGDITDADLLNGLFDDAEVVIFVNSYEDMTLDPIVLAKGYVGEVKAGRGYFEVEVVSLIARSGQAIGKVCSPLCRVKQLGDAECGVDLAPFQFTGAVAASTSKSIFTTTSAGIVGKAEFYFAYGTLEWLTGPNAGKFVEVRTNDDTNPMEIVLWEIMPFPIGAGDTFEITAGCDRRLESCRDKFANVLNFRGEPFVPGNDAVLRVIR